MGYGVYEREGRWCGYGVPATCDFPGCGASIDRGLAYLCGGQGDGGCGLFFCGSHLGDDDLCEQCRPGMREHRVACAAVEQFDAEVDLELGDGRADRRL